MSERNSELSKDIIEHLCKIASFVGELDHPRWIGGSDDQGSSYCFDCASKIVEEYNKKHPNCEEPYFVDGGYGSDNDGVCSCEKCGKLLEYTLTDSGIFEELEHFESLKDDHFVSISPNTAYELAELFNSGATIDGCKERLEALSYRISINCGIPH